MKKLFALLMVAGSFAMFSCGGGEKKEEAAVDTTAVETQMETPADTAAAPADTAAAATDTAAAAAPAH
jgi:hypothetical protein